ncbi:MAG TPA: Npt1/Npt2 family nucleotide transporter [Bryobacteraceae bacterium]
MPSPAPPGSLRKTFAERALSVVADVRAGEGSGVLLLSLNVFLLLTAYYFIRPVRNALILTQGGAEVRSYSAAGQAVLLLAVVPIYGALASRMNRIRLISWVSVFFAANLVVFYAAGMAGAREGVVFYLWVGIFNVLIIAQFWAFANDLYTESSGKRLFPILMLAANLGAIAGGKIEASAIGSIGPYGMMLSTAGLLMVCIAISHVIHKHAAADPVQFAPRPAEEPLAKTGAWELIARDRYLLLIAALMVLLNLVNSSGEYLLARLVEQTARAATTDTAAQQVIIGRFYGNFDSLFSTVGMLLQVFAVSRIFRYIGVRGALFILPCIALVGYSFVLFLPLLAVIRWAKIAENGTDYSIQNTTRQALFLPTSREAKYKAKTAIDTFFQRGGDVLSAAIVGAGAQMALNVKWFAAVNAVLTLVWLVAAFKIGREYDRRTEVVAEAVAAGTGAVAGSSVA